MISIKPPDLRSFQTSKLFILFDLPESLLHPWGQLELLHIVQVPGQAAPAPLEVLEEELAGVGGATEGNPARVGLATPLTEDQLGGSLTQAASTSTKNSLAGWRLRESQPGLQFGDNSVQDGVGRGRATTWGSWSGPELGLRRRQLRQRRLRRLLRRLALVAVVVVVQSWSLHCLN